jgi:hypothetical protein
MKHSLDSLPLSNSFASLSGAFYSAVTPTPFEKNAHLIHFNGAAAELLDLHADVQRDPGTIDLLSGKRLIPDSQPLAMLYAGHQFGHLVPQLGDGRAILLGETTNGKGEKWEIQLKGSGLTPYSRDGDGRAVLRSTIREYLCSEAMHGLGIPTTRALCMIGSDDEVYRERIERGAMLTRLAPTHVRFGSFEVFYYRNQFEHIKTLADYVITHHYPELSADPDPYLSLLRTVIERTAQLIAQWQAVAFAHGVMNTDNMSILGLTLDYGPFGFLDAYEPGFICNHSDYRGRYAFDQQANVGLFNLSCLAQAILPLLHEVPGQAAELAKHELAQYAGHFVSHYSGLMRKKLGLATAQSQDQGLIEDLLTLMATDKVDYTILFRQISTFTMTDMEKNPATRDLFIHRETFDRWAQRYSQRLRQENSIDPERHARMQAVNPKYVLRNYMAEIAIRKSEEERDYTEIDRMMSILQDPYGEHPEYEHYAGLPPTWSRQIAVSCSS